MAAAKKEWKVDQNGRRWFRHANDTTWVPVPRTYSEEAVHESKKRTLDELISHGIVGALKYEVDLLVPILQRDGLTDEAWERVATIWEIADIGWAARRNGRSLRQTRAAGRRREIKELEQMLRSKRGGEAGRPS